MVETRALAAPIEFIDRTTPGTLPPRARCVHELIDANGVSKPSHIAISAPGEKVTYRELKDRTDELASHLIDLGVRLETRVGICVERSVDAIIGFLAVMKAGGAYVPLNPSHPAERLEFIIEDSAAKVLLVQPHLQARLPHFAGPQVVLGADRPAVGGGNPRLRTGPAVGGRNLAYVMYTSGSTGRPKGVLVEHRGLTNVVLAQIQTWGIRPDDRIVQFLNLSFDAAQAEIYRALVVGATLCLPSPETLPGRPLFEFLRNERINLYTTLPSVLSTLPMDEQLPDLRIQTLGGEPSPAELAAHWGRGRKIFIGYGPTEATVCATIATEWDHTQPPPIGEPIVNTAAYLLDEHLHSIESGKAGELYLGGIGVTRGYANQPDVTAERFLPDPFGGLPGARMYRTGDLARRLPDGNLEFLGRADDQVKVLGYRIELGEIEAALGQHPNVRHGVVVAHEIAPGDKRLVGYVVAQHGEAPSPADLRLFLKPRLPEYMVPSAFVSLAEMPRTINGKADRKALPVPDLHAFLDENLIVPPRNAVEESLASVWAQVLRLGRVGVYDNFFELGGNSLLATQVTARVRETLGRELPLRAVFEEPTIAGLASRLSKDGALALGEPIQSPNRPSAPLRRTEREGDLPLSFSQHRLWFMEQLEPGNPLYNLPAAMRLRGQLDIAALEGAINAIVRRHEVLRTTFATRLGQPIQVIHPPTELSLPVIDLTDTAAEDRDAVAMKWAREESMKPFDLARGPLLRPVLLRFDSGDHLLLPTMHHVVSDAWSLAVFTRELAEFYTSLVRSTGQREHARLPELPIQYADFAVWQRQWLRGEVLESQLEYWRKELANLPLALELPTDHPRPPLQRFQGSHVDFRVSRRLTERLEQFSREHGATLYMTLLAAYQSLLSRYSGQTDFAVGSPIAGRNHPNTEDLIGFFVNILVLRARLGGEPSFIDFVRRTRETCLEAFARQDVSFEQLVDDLRPERDLSRAPLFQAGFILQNAPAPTLELPGVTLTRVDVDQGTAKSDLSLNMTATADGLIGRIVFNIDLFEAATMARMARHYEALLEAALDRPDHPVQQLPLLTEAEANLVLRQWNQTARAYPRDACVHHLFEDQAARAPDAAAISFRGRIVSYRELNRQANRLARRLHALGVRQEVTVALCAERSIEAVIGIIAVLKAGGAYVPLDPTNPPERLANMIADAEVAAILCRHRDAETFARLGKPIVDLDSAFAEGTSAGDDTNTKSGVGPLNLAYVIFTSGSTGRPKGVMVPHRGLTNVILTHVRAFELGPGSRLPQFVHLNFDASQAEIWRSLVSGATLCPAPADIALAGMPLLDIIRGEALTMVGLPPSALTAFMDEDLSNIRTLIAAGEACSAELAAHWSKGRRLWNAYGPTETTICATLATDWDPRRAPPIGRPIANTQCYVLDRFLQPAPLGVAGELYIGGEGVTRGYLDQPDLTAAVFLPDPFGGRMGARMYKSGDLVRWRAEGSLEFLGRVDQQVKIRGFRIELGEIEAALRRHPSIDECVVIAREDSPGMKRLAAYIVSCQPGLDPAALRAFLHERLPEYMVPAAIVFLPALPLMDQGKVDRKALPNPDLLTGANEDSHVAPRTANEQLLAGIWAEILHRERIGVHDNFFEIGGDSIKSIQVIARANRAGLTLTAKDLFQHQSVAELAAAAERSRSTVEGAPEFDRASEWEFWRTVLSHDDVPLPVEGAAMDNERVTHHPPPLDERLTRILLDAANSEHGDETIDFLLTALAQALYAWTGERAWLVEVQSRVARQPDSEKDDERVIYPMRVEISEGSTSLESLQEIRSRRRAMPSGGRHFMKLWNSGDSTIQAALRAMPAPRIRIAVDSDRASSPRVSVPWNGSPLYALDIGVRISSDGMRADWNYTSGEFQPGTIELVATTYVDRLQTLLRDWDTERMTKAIPEDDRARLLAQFESSGDGEEAR